MKDVLQKLDDLNRVTGKNYTAQFFSDGSGFLTVQKKIPFINVQECREEMYQIILKTKNSK